MNKREVDWNPTDADWSRLVDDTQLDKRRKKAEQKFSDLTSDQIKYIRRRAKTDLFFLATGLLEYDLMSIGLHGHYCRWLEKNRGWQYRMTLFARGHYKSTTNTISDSIQMALPNDAQIIEHPYCLGPDIKLLIGHENRESASRFLYEITEAFTAKPAMLAFFPECIPTRKIQRVNKWELELPRNAHHKEPTFDTIGAGGAAQGRHYHWFKLDDLIGEDARDSETVMKRILTWFDNVNSLKTRPKLDGWDLIGTHWSTSDVYAHAIKTYGLARGRSFIRNYFKKDVARMEDGVLAVYGRSVEEDGVIVFPEEFPPEEIARLRKNPKVFASQYANNPKDSGLTLFQPGWIKHYNVGNAGRLYVFAGDNTWSVDRRDLDVTIQIDPSPGESDGGDESGIVVVGIDKSFNIYILEAYKKRFKPPELIAEMLKLYTRWWPRHISVENVNFSAIYKYWFEAKCKELRIFPSIYDYKPGSERSKKGRIAGLTHYFAAGQVYMLEGMTQLRDELEWYPLGDGEHILDALAQGPEFWRAGISRSDREAAKKAVNSDVQDERDTLTGY